MALCISAHLAKCVSYFRPKLEPRQPVLVLSKLFLFSLPEQHVRRRSPVERYGLAGMSVDSASRLISQELPVKGFSPSFEDPIVDAVDLLPIICWRFLVSAASCSRMALI